MDRSKRILLGAIAAASLMLILAGCSSQSAPPPSADEPIGVEQAGYEVFHTELKVDDLIVTCFEDGIGETRVLSCFPGAQDIAAADLRDFDTLGYELSYVDAGQGVTVACFEDGIGKTQVMSCFPIDGQ